MSKASHKLIVVIEIEMEKEVASLEIGDEVCKRIAMHPHVMDANLISVGGSLEMRLAPKPFTITNNFHRPIHD